MAKSPADRVKKARLAHKQQAGEPLTDDEAAFLDDYEGSKPAKQTGRSASARRVQLDIEEVAEAEGDHLHPDAYAGIARAEGLRADTLLRIVTDKLIACNEQYMKLMMYMMDRSVKLEEAHIGLLEAVRTQVLARVDAEAEARALAALPGGEDGSAAELLGFLQLAMQAQANQKGKKKSSAKKEKPLGAIG